MKTNAYSLPPFVRAYLETALWSSNDESYFSRKAAQAAGWSVHSETVDGAEMWVAVAPGENGADFVHEMQSEADAWKSACEFARLCPSENLDSEFDASGFSPAALARAVADCEKFQAENAAVLAAAIESGEVTCGPDFDEMGRAGHDFWLTRNGHGAGFWDGDWPKEAGEKLSEAARAFGELNPYVDENGQISFE